ncbi:Ricin-type beta-trefoil lectin domain-like [Paenibacillus sp. UNCCL117]|uniref:RICIN domain-containing protein n=1 Tax=unclassified Paenibacillus TaxID=185978 RepID=UPI00088F30E7|nr:MULTISPECIES: RICIN domain-containing protein [unclassified Paenibacillus]SDC26761.1 Ricin-type beta-trefoil lectin domain-like [Paenibacillus sp. cl123]SFW20175.1 Ricin-type beta-trefoil lectin domain-like [Paenibacillus sp. UNCCL117]
MKRKGRVVTALTLIIIFLISTVSQVSAFGPITFWSSTSTKSASYARAMILQNSGVNNGKMYATHEIWTDNQLPHPAGPSFPVYESTDGGQSWTKVGEVTDIHSGEGLREQGILYELPQGVGDMPKGTMLMAVNAFPEGELVHNIELYKSNNLGRSWTYVSTIASGGAYGGGMNWESQGIWEPFLMVADGKLYCFYADEQDPNNNQMIVHRSSLDGVNWSQTKVDVALGELRPGMPTVTKMGNGKYMLVYEIVNMQDDWIHYKISSDPDNWGNAAESGKRVNYYQGQTPGSQPYVVWVPGGSPNGTVVISGGRSDKLFLNYNYGEGHWTTQDSVITLGYSRSLVPVSDNKLFVISTVKNSSTGKSDVKVGTTDIVPSNNVYNNNLFMLVNKNGKAMDLIGGGQNNGSVINQWSYDYNGPNQRWSIVPTGNGYFRMVSVVNGKYAAVQGNSASNGAQLVSMPYEDGNAYQQWHFVDIGNGWFKIVNVGSGKVLDVDGNSLADNAKMQQWEWTGAEGQYWRIQPHGDYYVQAEHSGKYLNAGGAGTTNGTPIIQWGFETNNWFKWKFESVGDGYYKVVNLNASTKVADVAEVSLQAGAEVHLWDYVNAANQQVRLVPQQDGSFKFYFKHSNMAWDISGVSRDNGAKLTQYTEATGDNQKFYLEKSN